MPTYYERKTDIRSCHYGPCHFSAGGRMFPNNREDADLPTLLSIRRVLLHSWFATAKSTGQTIRRSAVSYPGYHGE
jgi:hypothetical protein